VITRSRPGAGPGRPRPAPGPGSSRPRPAPGGPRPRLIIKLASLGAIAALGAGCGSAPDDLFVVQRSGAVAGAGLKLTVRNDGAARCDTRPARITDDQLLRARELQRDLEGPVTQALSLPPGPQSVLTYSILTPGGTVRFSDSSPGVTPVLLRAAAFTHELAQTTCHRAL